MGILEHVDDGKIRPHVPHDQRAEGDCHETELRFDKYYFETHVSDREEDSGS
jgi:hypothetical protein